MLDNTQRAKRAIIFIWISLALTLISVGSDLMEYELLERMNQGDFTMAEAENNDLRQLILGILIIGIAIANVVIFVQWFRRAYANLARLGMNTKHNDSWAFWAWGVPIISL